MQIIFLKPRQLSGNRGREPDKSSGVVSEMPGIQPKQSVRTFVPPATGSVKRSPSVKEYIKDATPEIVTEKTNLSEPETNADLSLNNKVDFVDIIDSESKEEDVQLENIDKVPVMKEDDRNSEVTVSFEDHWRKAIDLSFGNIHTVKHTLKEYIPEIVDRVIYVKVKNEIQKDEIESKQREVLAYLRAHFDESIENIEILVDENLPSSVKIIDARDKYNLLQEQNQSLSDFLQILNINLKD